MGQINIINYYSKYQKMKKLSFAIIGGGPAGFYTAKLLSKLHCQPIIHVIQKQLCPFGLIRFGVAPDHITIKKAQATLSEASGYPNFQYIGNKLITPQNIKDLQQMYSGIIYSFGASGNFHPKWMPLNKKNIKFAREIVYWYNNHPKYEHHQIDLSETKDVCIIGNGNVAIDIARILLREISELEKTQISENALKNLRISKTKNVNVVARRGVTHSAFALKQVRQLKKCGIQLYAIQEQLQDSMTQASHFECTAIGNHFSSVIRMNKRKMDYIKQSFKIIKRSEIPEILKNEEKKVIFRYLLNPLNVLENQIDFHRTMLQGQSFKQVAVNREEIQKMHFDLLIVSAGFEVQPLNPSHHDQKSNKLLHQNGCVTIKGQKIDIGKYAVGWCKNGPRGVIDQTLLSCEETFNNIRIHFENQLLKEKTIPNFTDEKTISFDQYREVLQLQLARGDKQKYIKKKLSERQLKEIYGLL